MLALRLEFLTGRYVATAYNDRRQAEWPPHPARVFSALVSTCMESGGSEEERDALRWLAGQGPPELCASQASHREIVTVFVPVNDTTVARDLDDRCAALDDAEAELATASHALDAEPTKQAQRAVDKARAGVEKQRQALERSLTSEDDSPTGRKAADRLLPDQRTRQGRTFPSVTPVDPVFHLVWQDAAPSPGQRAALARVAERFVRLGHSSSLVSCSLVDTAPASTWVPDQVGAEVMRVATSGQLERLDEEFARHQSTAPRVLPCSFQSYRHAGHGEAAQTPVPVGALGADWIVLRCVHGPRLPSSRAVEVATAVRGALMRYADQPPRPILSGHADDGAAANTPHLAIVPLPYVGSRYADGRIMGVALVLPRQVAAEDRRHVLRAVGRWEQSMQVSPDETTPWLELQLGRAGVLQVERVLAEDERQQLRPGTWCKPSHTWVTATPIALDRNPGKLRSNDTDPARRAATEAKAYAEAEAIIRQACVNLGLPDPLDVEVLPSVSFAGTEKAVRFPPFPPTPGRTRRVKVHARVRFATPVAGPVLLGAGRYLGLGLLRPSGES